MPLLAAVLLIVAAVVAAVLRRRLRAHGAQQQVRVGRLVDHTGRDVASGSVYSIQTATLTTPTENLDRIWTPMHLERLARSYWRYMQRFSLGMVRVHYDDRGRYVCLFSRRIVMLGFSEPEYEFTSTLGLVRWPITRGLLVSRRGRDRGFLEIEVHRRDGVEATTGHDGEAPPTPLSQAYVELEVSQFYPAMSSGIAYWIYKQTQSRYHVLLAYGFIRSLASGQLAESVVGRFAPRLTVEDDGPAPEQMPTPSGRS
ncbi:hypothetical protein PAI11_15400 [Patulibacter medicamentivorans]|jgi:hypothetical protein|uniref:Uncharacterized protein n=1 Tax=Patulibacter medicamentivorans TaxID=1097667 RepID=H0E414_9ACTN|nr:hypothetical protein [Patulibacter medicamentivorans]EHN11579.1 hypothetical protein PAI11_15400 [Patulibacter medicamentivorans]